MWLNKHQYNKNDICPICQDKLGKQKAVFRTPQCGHLFHNNCLLGFCNASDGNIVCPVCRGNVGESCMDVWAFRNKAIGEPETNLNRSVYRLYNSQRATPSREGGSKTKRRNRRNAPKKRQTRRNK